MSNYEQYEHMNNIRKKVNKKTKGKPTENPKQTELTVRPKQPS